MVFCHALLYRGIAAPTQRISQHYPLRKVLIKGISCGSSRKQSAVKHRLQQRKTSAGSVACGASSGAGAMRVWAVSDVHSDYKENMAWYGGIHQQRDS